MKQIKYGRKDFLLALMVLVVVKAGAETKLYQPPRMADGTPSFQGITWVNANNTPLERMEGFPTLGIDQSDAFRIRDIINNFFLQPNVPIDPDFRPVEVFPINGFYHSSLIVEPSDGRLPGNQLFKSISKNVGYNLLNALDGPEQRPISERCIGSVNSLPPHIATPGYDIYQFIQTPDYVVFWSEAMDHARVIRMHSNHGPAEVLSLQGDSIGWWQGDALVVETKYFSKTSGERTAPFVTFFVSAQATVKETFVRVSDSEISYVFTVDDPVYYTQPWKAESHFLKEDTTMYESSCHEGNYSLANILMGGRKSDRKVR